MAADRAADEVSTPRPRSGARMGIGVDEEAIPSDRVLMGRGSEAVVERAFKRWLEATGWRLIDETGSWADLIAERGSERLIGEVKGYNQVNTGIDIDTMFGQILRRMKPGAATT